MIAALHERHSRELLTEVTKCLDSAESLSLGESIKRLVDCVLDEHLKNPRLHRILEVEFPSYEDAYANNLLDQKIVSRCKVFLELHQKSITQKDLDTAAYFVIKTLTSLSHAIVIESPDPNVSSSVRDFEKKLTEDALTLTA